MSFLDRVAARADRAGQRCAGPRRRQQRVRAAIGFHMYGLPFTQSRVVIDVDTDAELNQWEGCHQLCNPQRAGTYMRVGQTRYRWEFQLLDGETAADYQTITDIEPLIAPWLGDTPAEQLRLVRVTAYTFRAQVASRWRDRNVFILGDAAHLTPPFVGQGMAAGPSRRAEPDLETGRRARWHPARKRAGHLRARTQSPCGGHDFDGRVGGSGDDRGGRLGDLIRHVVFPRMQNLRLPGTRTSAADGVAPRSLDADVRDRLHGAAGDRVPDGAGAHRRMATERPGPPGVHADVAGEGRGLHTGGDGRGDRGTRPVAAGRALTPVHRRVRGNARRLSRG